MKKIKLSAVLVLLVLIFAALTFADGGNPQRINSIFFLVLLAYGFRVFSGVDDLQGLIVWVAKKKQIVFYFFLASIWFGWFVFIRVGGHVSITYAVSTYAFILIFVATISAMIDWVMSRKK